MYSQNNLLNSGLIIIKPKIHIVNFIKNNSFFNKIIGFNEHVKNNNIKVNTTK
jgi:hypothetical protein